MAGDGRNVEENSAGLALRAMAATVGPPGFLIGGGWGDPRFVDVVDMCVLRMPFLADERRR